ncbi:MAG: hypothetical protein KF764_04120 [Labilithrix sp.]|nr:hypothetical protein [Labilithrix sp.]
MNSNAKTTAFSLLAVAAVGAAVFMGCTVGSGTVDDTDGGDQPKKDGGSTEDTGTPTDDAGAATCESKQEGVFVDETCQACVAKSCCTELKTCYDLPGDDANGKVDCNAYDTCIDDCGGKAEGERADCYKDCDDTAATGVQSAYEAIESCAKTNCATECGAEAPDGG